MLLKLPEILPIFVVNYVKTCLVLGINFSLVMIIQELVDVIPFLELHRESYFVKLAAFLVRQKS